jgi:hypothetical protein
MLAKLSQTLENFLTPIGFWIAIAGVAGVLVFWPGRWILTYIAKRRAKKAGMAVRAGEDPLRERRAYLPTKYPGDADFPRVPNHPLDFQWHSDLFKRWALRSERKTTREYKELLSDYLGLCQTWGELQRTEDRQHLEDLKLKADIELAADEKEVRKKEQQVKLKELDVKFRELDLKAAEIEKKMRETEHPPSPAQPKTHVDKLVETLNAIAGKKANYDTSVQEAKRALEELKIKNPECADEFDAAFRRWCQDLGGTR